MDENEDEMKKSEVKVLRFRIIAVSIASLMAFCNAANAETLNSVSHIHQVKVVEKKVLVLTHEGLYELVSKDNMKLVGKDKIDVMGFTSVGKVLFASGHPAQGSKMPNPLGLIKSIDGGLSWKAISLTGKVDFHFLKGAGSDLYGADSQSGDLLYSADSGKAWRSLGKNAFLDIAVSPMMSGMAIGIKNSELLLTENAFKSTVKIKNSLKITQIEWLNSGIYALGGSSIYKSINAGKAWTKLSTFKGDPGIFSASDQLMLATMGSSIYTSKNGGKSFRKIS